MASESINIIKDISAIILMVAGAVLCVVLTVAIAKVFPSLRRSALNIEQATERAAEAGPNIVAASGSVKEIAGNLAGAAKDISESTPALRGSASNIEKFTGSAAEAGPNIVAASENVKETTGNVLSASKDLATATPVLQWLGPAGAAANIANTGLGRLGGFLRRVISQIK